MVKLNMAIVFWSVVQILVRYEHKIKLSLIKHYAMTAYGGVDV
jgi:hypothetical protein